MLAPDIFEGVLINRSAALPSVLSSQPLKKFSSCSQTMASLHEYMQHHALPRLVLGNGRATSPDKSFVAFYAF